MKQELKTIEIGIEGMDCPSCVTRIEKTISKLEDVKSINVSLASDSASINYNPVNINLNKIKSEIEKLGYSVTNYEDEAEQETIDEQKKKHERIFLSKIFTSVILSAIIFFLGMQTHFTHAILSHTSSNLIQLILSTIVIFWCGLKFLKGFINSIKVMSADMDTLISLGVLAAYFYSVAIMFSPGMLKEVYFETGSMIVTFILIGNFLEFKLRNRTQSVLNNLIKLQSKKARVLKGDSELNISSKLVKVADIVLIKHGEVIPVDGKVIEGESSTDESMLTGESMPVHKTIGSNVFGGSINNEGYLKIETTKRHSESMISRIISIVKDSQKSKPRIQRLADKVSAVFVPIVIVIAVVTFLVWYFLIQNALDESLLKAVSVLIVACPCALGLATPLAIIAATGRAAENHVLINNIDSLEKTSSIDTIVFDKTGTLTEGNLKVESVNPLPHQSAGQVSDKSISAEEILKLAASIERYSEHPVAKSIVKDFLRMNTDFYKVTNFKSTIGIGVEAEINGVNYRIGKKQSPIKSGTNGEDAKESLNKILIYKETNLLAEIVLSEEIKTEARQVIDVLRKKFQLQLLSGDNEDKTRKAAEALGINNYVADNSPENKLEYISTLQKQNHRIAMIGDGINDAPALARSDLGIALGTGQDLALNSADVILVNSDIKNVPFIFKLSAKTMRIIKQNLFWAFFYNVVTIPIAAGVFAFAGIILSPVMASMLMALSDVVTVFGNSLRLKYGKV